MHDSGIDNPKAESLSMLPFVLQPRKVIRQKLSFMYGKCTTLEFREILEFV
jgi:hypothetical protein